MPLSLKPNQPVVFIKDDIVLGVVRVTQRHINTRLVCYFGNDVRIKRLSLIQDPLILAQVAKIQKEHNSGKARVSNAGSQVRQAAGTGLDAVGET